MYFSGLTPTAQSIEGEALKTGNKIPETKAMKKKIPGGRAEIIC